MSILSKENILILAKTYPSPSSKYIETSCVAGINSQGEMRRLYPVPFRFIEQSNQFKKWQWVELSIKKSIDDKRRESYKIDSSSINCGIEISTKNNWALRKEWLEKIPSFNNLEELELNRQNKGNTLAIFKPHKLLSLEISKSSEDWTKEEKLKLQAAETQKDIFIEDNKSVAILRKIPFDFYYNFIHKTPDSEKTGRLKITDWEAGALFWNCQKSHNTNWEKPFRKKYEEDFFAKDLSFLVGNVHRFPNQWLIISVFYPVKQIQSDIEQFFQF